MSQARFDAALAALLDELFAAYPIFATALGNHDHDAEWPDPTEAGRQTRLAMISRHEKAFEALEPDALTGDQRIDRGLVLDALAALRFEEDDLREQAWDALRIVREAGEGLFLLLARDFAPWPQRGMAFVGRLRGLPAFLDGSLESLTGSPDRPISKIHAEIALAQAAGLAELIDQAISEADLYVAQGQFTEVARELAHVEGQARAALANFGQRLESEVMPRAHGDGRLGRELFARKLRHTLATDMDIDEFIARARGDYELIRAELLRIATDVWPQWFAGEPLPEDPDEVIRAALDHVAERHRQPAELLDFNRAEVARIEEFCRANDVIGLPDEPLMVTWTPAFMRPYGRAFLQSPGPLDKGLPSYFWITPPDEDAGAAAVESYLREDNDRMCALMAIHEGVPGHYLQGAYANRTSTMARAVFQSGTFAEGWAVYVTQVMMDLGFDDNDPALMLTHWKFYLRAVINSILDVGVHAEGMTRDQAMAMMTDGGFQEEDEAGAKWIRAQLSSTQLCTYYLGSLEMWELELEARRRAAAAAGQGEESIRAQHIAGGIGQSPDFDYRAHLEAVISHGTPPIKWLWPALFGEAN